MTPDHADQPSAHAVRQRHINREAVIRAIGICLVVAPLLAIPYAIIAIWIAFAIDPAQSVVFRVLVLVSIVAFLRHLGMGLNQLQNWARLTVLASGAITLAGAIAAFLVNVARPDGWPDLPPQVFGIAIFGGMLAVVTTAGRTAAYVCSREYEEIVTRTAPDFFAIGRAVAMAVLLSALCGIVGAVFN